MRQSFRLIVRFSSHVCTVQADKFISPFSTDFVILNDNPDLLDKTGVEHVIFRYEAVDKSYLHPKVLYRYQGAESKLPNFSFESAIAESIKRYEGLSGYAPVTAPMEKFTLL